MVLLDETSEDSSSGEHEMPVENYIVELFHWISEMFNLLVALEEQSNDHHDHLNLSSGNVEHL